MADGHDAEGRQVSLRLEPGAAVVDVRGDVDLDTAVELWSILEQAAAAARVVVVDLSGTGTIDSTGVGALVRGHNAAGRSGGEVLLAGPSDFLRSVLQTVGLHTTFPTYPTVRDALAAAGPTPPES